MKFKKSILGTLVSMAISTNALAVVTDSKYTVIETNGLTGYPVLNSTTASASAKKKGTVPYIVQLKGDTGVNHASKIGELVSSNPNSVNANNKYDARSPRMAAYASFMKDKQKQIVSEIGNIEIIHSYVHTFNGFAANLTNKQVMALRNHPSVASVTEDELQKVTTANTPEFLGLNSGEGQHINGLLGEDVIVGVVDSGIAPDNASFADIENSYSDPSGLGWSGACNVGDVEIRSESHPAVFKGEDPNFSCNNKLIGAKFFGGVFDSVYGIQTDLGEFISPRDADGHGSHTASTAAGNAGVTASLYGTDVGTISGIAPRARVAAYKVCWNADYTTPEGVDEAGCFGGDSMAAIDAAVSDGVDVINYSISGSRTSLIAPQTLAMLNAADAGVFVAVSAGNSGPSEVTVGTPAPWVTSVAASTYDGVSVVNAMEITSRTPQEGLAFTEGAITAPLVQTGAKEGSLIIAEPLNGCFVSGSASALENASEVTGNIALIQRGGCPFSEKVERAELAGATAVVIYTTEGNPITVLGGDGSFGIPGGMIGYTDGEALYSAISSGEAVDVKLSAGSFMPNTEVGNLIASFSSRGPNGSTGDLIKPDITAPGARILAATTDTIFQGVQGESNAYLSGTSMSSPHIAGMAALLVQEHPSWSPAQIKSALMTSARQNLTKQEANGVAADPFDFGSGHAVPASAREPGLTYNTMYADYLGFLCGIGETATVQSESGLSCEEVAQNISTDPSQLNYPSISVGELSETKIIYRTVTDVSGIDSSYSYTVEAPDGVDVTVEMLDENGGAILEVPANGSASYKLTLTVNDNATYNEWAFGAITLIGQDGTPVRSPIAVYPVSPIKINVPESISLTLSRGRATFPVEMLYSGSTSLDYAGLVAPFAIAPRTVSQDGDGNFTFLEAGTTPYALTFPASKVLRFSLRDELVSVPGADVDLYIHYLTPDGWVQIGSSTNGGSNEDIILVDQPAGTYAVSTLGWDLQGAPSAQYQVLHWAATAPESTTSVSGSTRAIESRFNSIRVTTRGLNPEFLYMGGVSFYDDKGEKQGTTVLEVQP